MVVAMSQNADDAVPRLLRRVGFGLLLLGGVLIAAASARSQSRFERPRGDYQIPALPECTCRAKGASFVVGTETCINEATYRCVMDQNVTSWQRLDRSCSIS